MFEESSASAIPLSSSSSILAFIHSWFTPTLLFVLLNAMIGAIALTSAITNTQKTPQNQQRNETHQPKIATASSLLQRLKSINFFNHNPSQDPQNFPVPDSDSLFNAHSDYIFQAINPETPQPRTDYASEETHFVSNLGRVEKLVVEENELQLQSMDEVYSQFISGHFGRTKSDTEPSSGKIPEKHPARIRKSASLKSPFDHFEEEDIVETRRPATVREKGKPKQTDSDEEVDAKADDFINKFKQQLKLQKLDSLVKYKDMVGEASG